MARLCLGIFLSACLVGVLHARWHPRPLSRRDDISGFPAVVHITDVDESLPLPDDAMAADEQRISNELKEYHCDPLESLVERLVNSSALDIYFKMLKALKKPVPVSSSDQFYRMIKSELGFDLREHNDRHRVACLLYGIDSLNDVAAITGYPIEYIEVFYNTFMEAFNEVGGVNTVNVVTAVSLDFMRWMVDTGYPNVPLKGNANFANIRDRVRAWQVTLLELIQNVTSRAELIGLMDDPLAPFNFSPEYTALVLTELPSTQVVLKRLHIKPEFYRLSQQFVNTKTASVLQDFIITLVKIVNELNNMGLFSLKREV